MNSTTSGFFGPSGLLAALSPETLPALASSDPAEFNTHLSANNSENATISFYSENSRPPKKRKICDLQDPFPSYSNSGMYASAGIIDGEKEVRGMSNLSEVHKMDLKDVDILPEDAAFAIDHIVESILSNLRNTDLTKTRLVSRRLNYFSSKQLEKKLKMIISLPSNFETFGYYDDVTIMTNSGRHEKTLEALNDFLSILNRANTNKFPCTSFNLYTDNLNGPYISKLFTYHGSHIKTLKLSLNYISRTTTEASVLHELKTVLVEQVPHLQCLELNAFISMNDRDQWHRHRSYRQTQKTENENETDIKPLPFVLPNLKSLNILGASFSIFEELMGAAVNLSSYVGHQNEFLNYFIQGPGISRLSLLKHLNIVPNKNELQLLETIASLIEKNKNEQLQIQLLHLSLKCLYNSGDLWPRASRVINNILRSSAGSVREMYWEPIRFLHGVQIPVMPKVSELVLLAMPKDMLCFPIEKHYFPVGFVMAKVFPSLKSIILFNNDVPGFSLTTLLDLTNMEQVASVRNVHFKKLDFVPTAEKELFSKVFSNAKIMPD